MFIDTEQIAIYMNQPDINPNLFTRLRFILVETGRAGHFGGAARAMKTSGV